MANGENPHEPNTVNFTYQKSDDYRIVHVTGAWGGLTPQGYIKFDLYTEYGPAPVRETREISEDGQLGELVELEREGDFPDGTMNLIRQMQVGVVMSPSDAENLAQWLLEKAAAMREKMDSGEDGS
ncbi:MAG: hypothetical protein ABEL51_13455 [Salinibacter sp.]